MAATLNQSQREEAEIERVVAVLGRIAARVTSLRASPEAETAAPRDKRSEPLTLPRLGEESRLAPLATRAGLDAVATDVLRMLLAAHVDALALKSLVRLGSDARTVTVEALVTAAAYGGHSAAAVIAALSPSGPLVSRGLVVVGRDEGGFMIRRLAIAPRLAVHVLARDQGAANDVPLTVAEARPRDQLIVDAELTARATEFFSARSSTCLWLAGQRGVGKRALLASLLAERGQKLLTVGYRDLVGRSAEELAPLFWRESLIHDAAICVHDADPVPAQPTTAIPSLFETLQHRGLPLLFTSSVPPALGDFDQPPLVLGVPLPSAAARAGLWRRELPGCERVDEAAAHFRLPPGRIVRVAQAARARAQAAGRAVCLPDITAAVSAEVAQKVTVLGTRIEDSHAREDLVLAPETLDAMREIVSRARHRHRVFTDWGFQNKVVRGLGLSALFEGPSGTGKTMVATIIARELGLDLYQIDLSRLVSKYVGETEKNLASLFEAADWGNVMLLFDEAEALFARRSDVKSSNDRYSNMEINYLLQRLERFEGVTILTTNLESSIDPAFKRRLTFRVEFSAPDEEERELLWRRMIPKQASVKGDIDFKVLAAKYELTGGNIKNAMLRAAFLAAEESAPIAMQHVLRSIALEYRDAGMISTGGRLS